MQREESNVELVNELKIDKDCMPERQWIEEYKQLIIATCQKDRVHVVSIRTCRSRSKGLHFYIKVKPAIRPELANKLQFLLGDDCQRVDFNRARIRSRLNDWNKLFEEIGIRLRTIYQPQSVRNPESVRRRLRCRR